MTAAKIRFCGFPLSGGQAKAGGGLLRHEGDDDAGGNEWVLTTLWLALHKRAIGDLDGCACALAHVVSRRIALDLLPEQLHPDGTPAWFSRSAGATRCCSSRHGRSWSHIAELVAPEAAQDADDGRGG